MSDSYQAIYDAVRSRISGGNIAETVQRVLYETLSFGHYAVRIQENITMHTERVAESMRRPSVLYRPKIYLDGSMWCALYGDNLQDGVAGFGETPELAMEAFDTAWQSPSRGAKGEKNG